MAPCVLSLPQFLLVLCQCRPEGVCPGKFAVLAVEDKWRVLTHAFNPQCYLCRIKLPKLIRIWLWDLPRLH